jgi:hypothetical protein
MREAVEQRIRDVLADADPRFAWLRAAVRQHGFLPLHIGWVTVLGLRPDGSWVRWDHEDAPGAIKPFSDPYWERMALCAGAENYPELETLVPRRPLHARDCGACAGTGMFIGAPITCACGGLGWLLPGEPSRA